MRNIVRFLKGHVPAILLILMLLVAEAWCDLALPGYTSDIVDVGIQQGGIASPLPEQLQSDSMELLTLFLSDSDANTVRSFYTLSSDGIWQLDSSLSGTQKSELETILITPMALCYTAGQQEGSQLDMLPQAIAAGQITKEQLLAMKDQALSQMGDISDSMLRQMATEYLKDEYSALGKDLNAIQTHYLLITGGKMLGITLLSVLCVIVITLLASRIAAAVSRDLRDQVFRQVLSFSAAEMDQFSTASLITRSTNDIQQIQMVIVMLLRMVLYAPILGIGGILKVAATKTGLGWIIAVAVGCLLGLVLILVSIAMPKFKKMQTLVDDLNLVSREILTGVPVIRAFSREQHAVDHFDEANTNLKNNQLFVNRVMAIMSPLMMFIMYGITAMIVWFGAKGIDLGTMQTGDLTAFITYTMQIVMSFMMITMVSIMLPRASVAADRIMEVLNTTSSVADPAAPASVTQASGELAFHDVSFTYPGGESPALSHISFTARPGETTAIIGSTGSGKSTLLNLIPRFYDASEGSITLDGQDIRSISQHDLRQQLGYVPQKGILFSGDIESNLKFGGKHISDDAMVSAARIAQADDFISQKAEGYHAPIAQGGSNVSGGQKQRLSIARAIAASPKIYLFDDSFSALDYKTDAALRQALAKAAADATIVIVAQRISTVMKAQQILVLDEGRIVGRGTHEELLKNCPTYLDIAKSQLSAKELGLEGGLSHGE